MLPQPHNRMPEGPRRDSSLNRFKPDLVPVLVPRENLPLLEEEGWANRVKSERLVSVSALLPILIVACASIFGILQFLELPTAHKVKTHTENSDSHSAEEVAKRFLAIAPDRKRFLRNPHDIAHVSEHFLQTAAREVEQQVRKIEPLPSRYSLGMVYHPFEVFYTDSRTRYLAVVEEDGSLLVDWPAFARTDPKEWRKLLKGETDTLEVRVRVSPVAYYNYQFSDDMLYESIRIESPDLEVDLIGDLDRRSPQWYLVGEAISRSQHQISKESRGIPMTLRLASKDGSFRKRLFLVDEFLGDSWVASNHSKPTVDRNLFLNQTDLNAL